MVALKYTPAENEDNLRYMLYTNSVANWIFSLYVSKPALQCFIHTQRMHLDGFVLFSPYIGFVSIWSSHLYMMRCISTQCVFFFCSSLSELKRMDGCQCVNCLYFSHFARKALTDERACWFCCLCYATNSVKCEGWHRGHYIWWWLLMDQKMERRSWFLMTFACR